MIVVHVMPHLFLTIVLGIAYLCVFIMPCLISLCNLISLQSYVAIADMYFEVLALFLYYTIVYISTL